MYWPSEICEQCLNRNEFQDSKNHKIYSKIYKFYAKSYKLLMGTWFCIISHIKSLLSSYFLLSKIFKMKEIKRKIHFYNHLMCWFKSFIISNWQYIWWKWNLISMKKGSNNTCGKFCGLKSSTLTSKSLWKKTIFADFQVSCK